MENKRENENILMKVGCKITKQRQLILRILQNAEQPLTAEEIFISLKQSINKISLSTVYRNLDLLLSKGLVNKNVYNDNKARYDLKSDIHKHHLICTGCNKVVDINECPFKDIEMKLKNETEFEISGHKIEIYGFCPKCKNTK